MPEQSELEKLSALSTDVKYIVKSVDEMKKDFKIFQRDVVKNYAKKEDLDQVEQSLTYTNRTLTGTILAFLLSVGGFMIGK